MYQDAERAVLKLYRRIDADILRLRRAAGICCPTGCGQCCENPRVSASVAELLPLSRFLWQQGEAYAVLDTLSGAGDESRCVFYQPDAAVSGRGRCGMYAMRPLICRLFGFSFRTNKYGSSELVTCRSIKAFVPEAVQRIESIIAAGGRAGLVRRLTMRNAQMSLARFDPAAGSRLLPINNAIRCALERTGLAMQYDATCDIRPAVAIPSVEPPENDNDSSPPVKAA